MAIWNVFVAATLPILRMIIMCAVGGIFATPCFIEIITPEAQTIMSQLVFWIFGPALNLSKLIKGVNPSVMLLWWPIPAFVGVNLVIGLLVACIASKIMRRGPIMRIFVACAAIGNYGNLPLVLIAAMCSDPYSPVAGAATCAQGIAYVMYGAWVGNIATWTIGYWLLSPPKDPEEMETEFGPPSPVTPSSPASPTEFSEQKPAAKVSPIWKQLVGPPVVSVFLALLLACIPGAKHLIFEGHLQPIGDCIDMMGCALIPMIMLILGASVSRGPREASIEGKVIVAAILCRMFITPLITLSIVRLVDLMGLLPADDLVFKLVLVLQQTTPAAMNLGAVSNLHKYQRASTSVLLFWQYIVAAPIQSFYMAVFTYMYT